MAKHVPSVSVWISVSVGLFGCGTPAKSVSSSAPPLVGTSMTPLHTVSVSYQTLASDQVPLSLTTEDGNGLALAKVEAKIVIEGPLAFTELHLKFTNPDARVREGRFQITLPPGAAVNRFAMNVDGRWMEAEMVERTMARRAYEDFLHRRQDPALLEKQAGNQFAARVFPIPAKADKELIVSYAQEVGEGPYVLPLRGLPAIGQIDATARILRGDRAAPAWDEVTLSERGWQPDRDFAVEPKARPMAVASGNLVAIRVVPELGVGATPIHDATILVDDSASRALGWDHSVDDVSKMIASIAKNQGDPRITVAAFDQEVAPIYEGLASGFDAAAATKLRQRGALGASDLGNALAWAAAHGAKDRVVVVTDGVATAGETDPAGLGRALTALAPAASRVDVVLAGGIRDDATAKVLTHGLKETGAVLDLGKGPDEVARRLGLGTRSSVAVEVDGAAWTWPDHLDGMQPGDGATIYAELGATSKMHASIGLEIEGRHVDVTPVAAPHALVERAAAEAEVRSMEAQAAATTDPQARAALEQKIVELSIKERVMSDYTAMLVLETDADYARYGLDRKALAEILVVGKDGLELQHRAAPAVIAQPIGTQTATTKDEDKAKGKDRAVAADKIEQEIRGRISVDQRMNLDGGDRDGEVELAKKPAMQDQPATEPVAPPPPPTTTPPPSPSPAEREMRHADVATVPSGAAVRVDLPRQTHGEGGASAGAQLEPRIADPDANSADVAEDDDDSDARDAAPPWDGEYKKVMTELAAKHLDAALDRARVWHDENPGDVLGLIALGDALEARRDLAGAARAYGSIIDLFPGRADLRRFAGERLERIADTAEGAAVTRALALDTYRRAVDDRPDHVTGHRLYAYALLRAGRYADALAAIERGLDQPYPSDRFRGADRILHEDLGLIGAEWARTEPKQKDTIAARVARHGGRLFEGPTTRFILYWETDDNDVDFHIHDARGGHAFYKRMHLRSGGDLYADVTTGYGPEEFAIDGKAPAAPYKLQIHYFSRGPMGYGMGTLEILRRDRAGKLAFEHRPFIVMNDKAYVDLGTVK